VQSAIKVVKIDRNLALKKFTLFLFLVLAAITSKAQFGEENSNKFGIGFGVSYEKGYTNVTRQDNHIAENINFSYYPLGGYIPFTFEIQKGTLSGGGLTVDLDKYGRQYTNNYLAGILHGDFQAGYLLEGSDASMDILKGFYMGTGVGLVKDNDKVQRTNVIPANGAVTGPNVYVFPGVDNAMSLMVPLRIGYEYKINDSFGAPFLRISISYEHNIVFGKGLDGYDDPASKFKNNVPDQYRQISFGIKYDFGGSGNY
jgi:hypothetical protein